MEHDGLDKKAAQAANKAPAASSKKQKKKGSGCLKAVIVFLSLILALLIAVAMGMNYILGMFGSFDELDGDQGSTESIGDEFDTDSTIAGQETIETVDPDDVTFDTVDTLEGDLVNIMLIGQDRRPGESRSRSDSMILVTLNKEKNTIQLTSFMRDLYVQIPGYKDNRLNVAYRYGGTDLMNETFKINFGVEIDGNVMVDFNEFTEIIDILGGVSLDISEAEAKYMRNAGYSNCYAGENYMDGAMALDFCRMRYAAGGDYGRTERQRRTLMALAESVRNSDFATVWKLIEEVLPHIVTNLDEGEIVQYASSGLMMLAGGAEIESMRIPQDDAHYGASIRGMSVLVPDLQMCREDLEEFIFSNSEE